MVFVDGVISSGSLIRRKAIEKAGPPRADFFIDYIDLEHCLRLRRCGYKIAIVRRSILEHALGDPKLVRMPGFTRVWADHVPWREYYKARNEVFTIWSLYPGWRSKLSVVRRFTRHALGILLFGREKRACLKMMYLGIIDARAGRLGIRNFDDPDIEDQGISISTPGRRMPEMSVIIVNWNGTKFLPDCLSALRQQTFRDFETILVDNASTDDSLEYVRAHFPEVKIIGLQSNLGFSGGNIAGYNCASGEIIVLLNNDTEAHPEWLESIHRASREFPAAGSFACKMMYFNDRARIENCGFEIDSAGITAELGRDELDGPHWASSREVFGACGGAVAYRRTMLDQVGFLDPDFVMIYEDVDLSFRAQLSGFRCVYVPKAIVYHHYRSTIKKGPALQVFYSQRNIDFVYWKNLPLAFILRSSPHRLLYELGSALYFFRLGSGVPFFKAKLDVLRRLPSVLKKRKVIQKQNTLATSQLRNLFCGSVFRSKWRKFFSPGVASPSSVPDSVPGRKQVTAPAP